MASRSTTLPRAGLGEAPLQARAATAAWFVAVGAGVAESGVGVVGAVADGAPALGLVAQIALRTVIYGGLFVVIDRYFRHGVRWSRWFLAGLLGTLGLATLVVGPAGWLVDDGDFAALDLSPGFVGAALLRTAHLLALLAALALSFAPDTNRWFRRT